MLHDQGLSPSIVFSDVPSRDRRLLETIFPTLDKGVHEMDIAVNNDEGFEMLPLRGKILYEDNLESARASLRILSEALDEAPANEKVVSFDPEWPVFYGGKCKGAISVISLASPVTDDVTLIHIARISSSNTLLHQLKSLFSRSDVVFVGRMIKNDFAKFNKDFPNHAVAKPNVIDVGTMAVHRGVTKWKLGATTLQALVKKSLKKFLPKPEEIRVGDVFDDSSKMRDIVQLYCARDTEAGLCLYQEYINLPDLSARCRPQQIQIGMNVYIMSQYRASVEPIACGVIIQTAGNARHGLKLSKRRFLVKVTEVHNSDGIAHFPLTKRSRCKCNRNEHGKIREMCDIKCLSDFGEAPFTSLSRATDCDNVSLVYAMYPILSQ
jgi:hypothetical protein